MTGERADYITRVVVGHMYKAGTVFEYTRLLQDSQLLIFMLLEDRCLTLDTAFDSDGALCLVLAGHVYSTEPGGLVRLLGLIDLAKEIT